MMKIRHDDVHRIPAPDLAIMIDAGWVRHWPFEIRPAAVKYIDGNGWQAAMERATAAANQQQKRRAVSV